MVNVQRLQEIKDEIKELVEEAMEIVSDTNERSRAEAYWYPHLLMALDDEHTYMSNSMCHLQSTIDTLEESE
jgi:hypothetical protein